MDIEKDPNQNIPEEFDPHAEAVVNRAKNIAERFLKEEVLSADHLEMVMQSSGGFGFGIDAHAEVLGYTNLENRTIYINPVYLAEIAERMPEKDEKIIEARLKGLLYHEAGHHSPPAKRFQDMMFLDINDESIVPQPYQGSVTAKIGFYQALQGHLHNALADVWLESFVSRRPYYDVAESIEALHQRSEKRKFLSQMSLPEQFVQLVVGEMRKGEEDGMADVVDPEVMASVNKVKFKRGLEAIEDRSAYEYFFSQPGDFESALRQKYRAYRTVFLPEYLRLLELETERRRESLQNAIEKAKQGFDGEGQGGQGTGVGQAEGHRRPPGAPLTAEEEQMIEGLLKELQEAGKEFASKMPSKEEREEMERQLEQMRQRVKGNTKDDELTEWKDPGEEVDTSKSRELIDKSINEMKQQQAGTMAEKYNVDRAVIKEWERIKKSYEKEIDDMASRLAEVFLEDRRSRIVYQKREGDITPGLEYETVAAYASGDTDPETRMRTEVNPEFLETEIEFIVDVSGSMMGEPLRKSTEALVIVTEAFRRIEHHLSSENLLEVGEQPLRIGLVKFSVDAERVTKLKEPLGDGKELKMIKALTYDVGGGTDETKALKGVYKDMKVGRNNVLKMIIVLTDGYGVVESVRPILKQIERDDEVILLAVGLKTGADGLAKTYERSRSAGKESNIFSIAADNIEDAFPQTLEFIKNQIIKRKER